MQISFLAYDSNIQARIEWRMSSLDTGEVEVQVDTPVGAKIKYQVDFLIHRRLNEVVVRVYEGPQLPHLKECRTCQKV